MDALANAMHKILINKLIFLHIMENIRHQVWPPQNCYAFFFPAGDDITNSQL